MEEIRQLFEWHESGIRAAMATVIQTWGSSPRPVGSILAVSESGDIVGSVSGGCVEGEVIAACQVSLISGETQFLDFKQIGDDEIWAAGLTCGGQIEVFVEPNPFDSEYEVLRTAWFLHFGSMRNGLESRLLRCLSSNTAYVVADDKLETFPDEMRVVVTDSPKSLAFEEEGEKWFLHLIEQPTQLIIVGASHIAIPLIRIASAMGMKSTLIDPRSQLADSSRFAVPPTTTIVGWPEDIWNSIPFHSKTCIVTLSHDDKIDVPALALALRSGARYIGALGSEATQLQRRTKLLEMGVGDSEIDRIRGPIGIKIGAKSPEEIALSILAEIIQEFHNGR